MFSSVLIANRGEIACRIMRTARAMGIRTIAVYSDADQGAAHVRAADVAVRIGAAPAQESYLNTERILQVAADTQAEALHPGYGFLSEDAAFAALCVARGVTYVGPGVSAMQAVGSKNVAKATLQALGVPVLPGYHGERQNVAELEAEALRLGLPLLIKPSGGGGGKGMHIVRRPEELRPALESAQRLARAAFADPTLLLERYVASARHIEVQLLADRHGKVVCVGDRDCSLQRRHQKLIEEAPAPALPATTRLALHAAAAQVAHAVGYVNAGTVEFLYRSDEFWFMEMNARLQVEHPVSEAISGIDLVEWQFRIAAGEPLTLASEPSSHIGHAIEARVCAEDPGHEFMPSSGVLRHCEWPLALDGIRVDAGVEAHDHVPPEYDSLLGKVIAIGTDRDDALRKLGRALQHTRIAGVHTNIAWLQRVLRNSAFQSGAITTEFLAEHAANLSVTSALTDRAYIAAALAVLHDGKHEHESLSSPWSAWDAFRPGLPAVQTLLFGESDVVAVTLQRLPDRWRATVGATSIDVQWQSVSNTSARVVLQDITLPLSWSLYKHELHCWLGGEEFRLTVSDPRQVAPKVNMTAGALVASLPGVVASVAVKPGDRIDAGAVLMIIEAMKMEHSILAPHAGEVTKIHRIAGDKVEAGTVLIDLQRSAAGTTP